MWHHSRSFTWMLWASRRTPASSIAFFLIAVFQLVTEQQYAVQKATTGRVSVVVDNNCLLIPSVYYRLLLTCYRPFCAACTEGWVLEQDSCTKCDFSPAVQYSLIALLVTIQAAVVGIQIAMKVRGGKNRHQHDARVRRTLIRQVLNYLQVVRTGSFNQLLLLQA